MKIIRVALLLLLLLSVNAPYTSLADSIYYGQQKAYNGQITYDVVVGGVPNIEFPLRDIISSIRNEGIFTLYSVSGRLKSLYYVSPHNEIAKIYFNETVVDADTGTDLFKEGSIGYCRVVYSGYHVSSRIVSKAIGELIVTSYMLQGKRTIVHSLYTLSPMKNFNVSLKLNISPPLKAVVQFPGKGVVLDLGFVSLAIWSDDNTTINSTVKSRSEVVIQLNSANTPRGAHIDLIITLGRDIGETTYKVSQISESLHYIMEESQEFFTDLVKNIPRVNARDETITQMYYYSILTRLNSISLKGLTPDGIVVNVVDVWSSALMLPYIDLAQFRSAVITSINNMITSLLREENVAGKIDEMAFLSLSLLEVARSGMSTELMTRSMYLIIDSVLRPLLQDILSNKSVRLGLSIIPYFGEGKYSVAFGMLAATARSMAELARELGYDPAFYVNAYNKLRDLIEDTFYKNNHYIYAILYNGSIVDSPEYALYSCLLALVDPPHISEHIRYVVNMLGKPGINEKVLNNNILMTVTPYILVLNGYPDDGYLLAVNSYMKMLSQGILDQNQKHLIPIYDLLVIRGFAGLTIGKDFLILTPSMPLVLGELSLSDLGLTNKSLKVMVKGSGSNIKNIYVNDVAMGSPVLRLDMIPDHAEIFVELKGPETAILVVKVVSGNTPLKNAHVNVIVDNLRRLVSMTNHNGEAYFEVPRGTIATVITEYDNITTSVEVIVASSKQEVVIRFPEETYEVSGVSEMRIHVNKLETTVYELQKKVSVFDEEIRRIENILENITSLASITQPNTYMQLIVAIAFTLSLANIAYIVMLRRNISKEKLEGKHITGEKKVEETSHEV